MKTIKTVLLAVSLCLCAVSCEFEFNDKDSVIANRGYGGPSVTRTDTLPDFNAIVSWTGVVNITYGQKEGARHTAELTLSESIADAADLCVQDSTLYIGLKKGSRVTYDTYRVKVSSSSLKRISIGVAETVTFENGLETDTLDVFATGTSNFAAGGIKCGKLGLYIPGVCNMQLKDVDTDNLDVRVDGVGDIKLSGLDARTVTAAINGTGDITMSGKAGRAEYRSNGKGTINCDNLESGIVRAEVSGSADMRLWATDSLKGKANGVGKIRYRGNPVIDTSSSKALSQIL